MDFVDQSRPELAQRLSIDAQVEAKELQQRGGESGAFDSMGKGAPLMSSEGLKSYLMTKVDPKRCTAPLAAFCFMTGYM